MFNKINTLSFSFLSYRQSMLFSGDYLKKRSRKEANINTLIVRVVIFGQVFKIVNSLLQKLLLRYINTAVIF